MNINIGVHNEFDVIVTDAKSGNIKQKAKGYNIILNQFWTGYLSTNQHVNIMRSIYVGDGTATPLATDTNLTSYLDGKIATLVSIDKSTLAVDGIIKVKKTIRIEAAELNGKALSEVGFAYTGALGTKSLLKDANGNTIVINKTSSDVVDIFGTFYFRVPLNLPNGIKVDLGSNFIDAFIGSSNFTFSSIFKQSKKNDTIFNRDAPAFTAGYTYTMSTANKTITLTPANVVAGSGNIGGYGQLVVMGGVAIPLPQSSFSQSLITKETIGTGDGTKKDFPCEFGYILNNSTAKAYVNDVEVDATFDYNIPKLQDKNISSFLNIIAGSYNPATLAGTSDEIIFENPYHDRYPITLARLAKFKLYLSDNGTDWTYSTGSSSAVDTSVVDDSKYFKVTQYTEGTPWEIGYFEASSYASGLNMVHLNTAPADGDTVTLTYQPNCIAKNSTTVVNNISTVVSFNEYTPT